MRTTRNVHLMLILCVLLSAVSIRSASAQAIGQLTMHSEPGDYIGGGYDHSYSSATGTFSSSAARPNGYVDYVTISYNEPNYSHWWRLVFSTRQLGTALVPGTYTNAQRAPFAQAGHPGLEVSGDGRGCNTLTGSFTVEQAEFIYTSTLVYVKSFVATFEQHCEGMTPALTGRIEYNDTNDRTPPTTTISVSGPTGNAGWFTGPVQVTLTATDPNNGTSGVTSFYQLNGGPVQTYTGPFTISANGNHQVAYWSTDSSGNREATQSRSIPIDGSAPVITATSSLQVVNDRKFEVAQLTVSGTISDEDAVSNVNPDTATYLLTDEYGLVQPTGSIMIQADGRYSFSVLLDGPNNNDRDGRNYTLTIQASDYAGNGATHTSVVNVPLRK